MSDALAAPPEQTQALPVARAPVLLPALLDAPFDYRVPAGTVPGALVEVTLGKRTLTGAVWDGAGDATLPDAKIKPVLRALELPPLPARFRRFLDWMASYTLAPRGAVLSLCGLAHGAKHTRSAYKAPLYTPTLATLTAQQREAAQAIVGGLSKPILLDGVTGSGKTEVYFHAIAAALAAGKQVLVLLPEIALTHQWLERFAQQFGATPSVWHSQTTPAARARLWQAVLRGEAKLVVGARSALFLPFAHLGLIVVDEEHDPSYKQDDGVLYHARDMAVARARFEDCPIVLVSATPSLETLINVEDGKYAAVHLPSRFGAAGLPAMALVDLRNDPPERGAFLSPTLITALHDTLARGEQGLLFLNRRGYAPLLLCRGCGHRFECSDCSAWLVVHGKSSLEGGLAPYASLTPAASGSRSAACPGPRAGGATQTNSSLEASRGAASSGYLSCHHCGHREAMHKACPACEAPPEKLAACGPGIERIAEEVRGLFPDQRMAVLSSDEAVDADTWAAIERGAIDLIVGTQMVAKGHHFPRLTLVGVVDADVGLSGADLRAGERTFQLLHQLSGRAGRGDRPGRVLIQTTQPDHPIMQALAAHDRDAVMQAERQMREEGAWPPFGQLAAIVLDGADDRAVRAAGQTLARLAPEDARLRVLGPAPAPLSKLRGQYRYRLLVKAAPGLHLQKTLRAWLQGRQFKGVRLKIDVNPYYFL
jgi:primosomal protein N' (replication factor Y)